MDTKSGVWQFYQDGEWRVGMNVHNHRENTEAGGFPVRDLHVIPEGYALVPVEPTKEMSRAGVSVLQETNAWATGVYKAMITAAQESDK